MESIKVRLTPNQRRKRTGRIGLTAGALTGSDTIIVSDADARKIVKARSTGRGVRVTLQNGQSGGFNPLGLLAMTPGGMLASKLLGGNISAVPLSVQKSLMASLVPIVSRELRKKVGKGQRGGGPFLAALAPLAAKVVIDTAVGGIGKLLGGSVNRGTMSKREAEELVNRIMSIPSIRRALSSRGQHGGGPFLAALAPLAAQMAVDTVVGGIGKLLGSGLIAPGTNPAISQSIIPKNYTGQGISRSGF